MRGWILFKNRFEDLHPDNYEIRRFVVEAEKEGIDLKIVTPEQFDLIVTRDDRKSIYLDNQTHPLPEFFMPRMGSGTTYFALAVTRHLERLGVQVINHSNSVEMVKDKLYTQQILAAANLPIPKTMLVKHPVDEDQVGRQLGYPVVVKTLSGSLGNGVYLCEDRGRLVDLMDLIDASKSNANFILQEFISDSYGRDLRVLVIGGRVVACMQRFATDGGFKANYSRGGYIEAHPVTPEIERLALEATRTLALDVAGVDLLFDADHFKICEVNSSPQFRGLEQSVDVNVPHEIYHYIRLRLGHLKAAKTP